MKPKTINAALSVSGQIQPTDLPAIAAAGFRAIVCNRPDGEGADQPTFAEIEAAAMAVGLQAAYLPIVPGKVGDDDVAKFDGLRDRLPKPVLAYCRTGTRSETLWSQSEGSRGRPLTGGKAPTDVTDARHEVVIIGGGSADPHR